MARKLKTFDKKVNAFMRIRESGRVRLEPDYAEKFHYLPASEVHDLFALCKRIEATAFRLAKQYQRGAIDRETFQKQLTENYPFLEEKRLARLMSRTSYWAYEGYE
jgi:hypothetical protein